VLTSGSGADTITGGVGSDTITGGAGRDVMTGGGGADKFVFALHDTTPTNGLWDVINDWNATDKIHFAGPAVANANYSEITAADAVTAFNTAQADIAAGNHDVVAVQVGADVLLFVDSAANNTIGDAVVLIGKSLTDIDVSNFV